MNIIDLAKIKRGDAMLDYARALYERTGEQPRPIPLGELLMDVETYTTDEVAKILSVKAATVRAWLREGTLKGFQVGRGYRVSKTELKEFWRARGGGELFEPSNGGSDE
jgi:excisionase family DNA binding protein